MLGAGDCQDPGPERLSKREGRGLGGKSQEHRAPWQERSLGFARRQWGALLNKAVGLLELHFNEGH